MSQQEQPWQPGPNDLPFTTHLINPHGDRHLGFNNADGRFYRVWQHRRPEPLHTGDAILLRPSDVDQIIKFAMLWVKNHPAHPRSDALSDELAAGAKAVVLHFAQAAQAPVQLGVARVDGRAELLSHQGHRAALGRVRALLAPHRVRRSGAHPVVYVIGSSYESSAVRRRLRPVRLSLLGTPKSSAAVHRSGVRGCRESS